MYTVYAIHSNGHLIYIGSTADLHIRIQTHLSAIKNAEKKSNSCIQAMYQYINAGAVLDFSVIDKLPKQEALEKEKFLIRENAKTGLLLNIIHGHYLPRGKNLCRIPVPKKSDKFYLAFLETKARVKLSGLAYK